MAVFRKVTGLDGHGKCVSLNFAIRRQLTRGRVGIFLSAFLLCLAFLAGCGRNTADDNTTVTITAALTQSPTVTQPPTATQSPTPTPEREPKDYALSDLYTTVGRDNLYSLLLDTGEADGEYPLNTISDAWIAGDYVLAALSRDTADGESMNEYVLFHLGRPDLMRRMTPTFRENQTCLLPDGTVFLWDIDANMAHVYNRELEEIRTIVPQEEGSWFCVGFSEDGTLWLGRSGSEHCVIAYSADGTRLGNYGYGADCSISRYAGSANGKCYFCATNEDGTLQLPLVLNEGTTELACVTGESEGEEFGGLFASESTDFLWFVHPLGEPENGVFFRKQSLRESLQLWSGSRFLTSGYADSRLDRGTDGWIRVDWSKELDDFSAYDYRVYDFSDAKCLGSITVEEVPQYAGFRALAFAESGRVLFSGVERSKGTELLLWDLNAETAVPIPQFTRISEMSVEEYTQKRVAEIEKEYGITIHYDQESISDSVFTPWYSMPAITDAKQILGFVEEVAYYLQDYPKEICREMQSNDRVGLDLYLVTALNDPESGESKASGSTQTGGDRLAVVYTSYGLGSETIFLHETMHLMEHRILQYALDNGFNWDSYWDAERTTDQYPYTYGESEPPSDGSFHGAWSSFLGTDEIDPDEVWFARTYGIWNEWEDRATMMELMCDGHREIFETYPHLGNKAKDIAAVIRGAFPSIAASDKPFLWEQSTGIVLPQTRLEDWKKYAAEQ